MDLTVEEIKALEDFGIELTEAGWEPAEPVARSFGLKNQDRRKRVVSLALAFLDQFDQILRERLCFEKKIRPDVADATQIAAALSDLGLGVGGLPPAASVANVLFTLGVRRFCSSPPKRSKTNDRNN